MIDKLPEVQTTGCTIFLWREVPRAACVSLFAFKDKAGNYLVFVDLFVMFVVCAYWSVDGCESCAFLTVLSLKIVIEPFKETEMNQNYLKTQFVPRSKHTP